MKSPRRPLWTLRTRDAMDRLVLTTERKRVVALWRATAGGYDRPPHRCHLLKVAGPSRRRQVLHRSLNTAAFSGSLPICDPQLHQQQSVAIVQAATTTAL